MAKEMGNRKYFWYAILFQNVAAYCVSLMVYQLVGVGIGQVKFGPATVAAAILFIGLLYLSSSDCFTFSSAEIRTRNMWRLSTGML